MRLTDLTAKQGALFRYTIRLLLTFPETLGRNATLVDMLHLMQDPSPYVGAIHQLPTIARAFFENDFMNTKKGSGGSFNQTKEQIAYRIHAILENPALARFFTSQETKLDLFEELNSGKLILIDTARDHLKDASSIYGRVWIALILQALLERAAIEEKDRKLTYIYVDEAAQVFNENIDTLLTEVRKYGAGMILAHQYLDQASSALRASLSGSTNIKFASGVSAADARFLAPDMRTTPDFILSQPKMQFAMHIQGVTPHAVPTKVYRVGDSMGEVGIKTYLNFIAENRKRISLSPTSTATDLYEMEESPTTFKGDEDNSKDWYTKDSEH